MTDKPVSNLVMIVGMHRSGTSAVGHLLESLGFDFGGNLLEGIRSVNDEGFWEDREVVALNEHIFQLFDTSWFDFERLPGKWWEDPRVKDLIGVAETWFYESFARDKPIAVKDPRFCRLLPFWKRVFSGMDIPPHILFVFRHPAEVAASLKKRDGFSLQVGYLLWLSYVIDGLYYARNLELSLVCYEDLLSNPATSVKKFLEKDLSSFSGLASANLEEAIQKSLHADSRHQKVEQVLSKDEVQDDVQELAHELYDVLRSAASNGRADDAKSIADKYRKRLYRLLDHHKGVLSALQTTVKHQVEVNQKLSEMGAGHSHALSVIHDKDRQLDENKQFIEQCLNEIGKKDSQLAITRQELDRHQARVEEQQNLLNKNNALWEKFEILQQDVHGRELKLSESLAYIEKCEIWIAELNIVSEDCQRIMAEQRDYISRCEARITEQDQWLTENRDYIHKCEERIKEQDLGLAENRDYILHIDARIREQDNGLQIRDQMLGERLDRIGRNETRITELEQELVEWQSELVESSQKIETLNAQIEVCTAELNEKKTYTLQCENYIAEQDRALEDMGRTLADSQDKFSELGGNFAAQSKVLEQAQAQLLGLQQQILVRDTRIDEINVSLENKQKEIFEYTNQITKINQQVSEQQAGLAGNRDYIAKCEARIAEQDHQLLQQQKAIADNVERISQRDIKIVELDKMVVELQQALTGSKDTVVRYAGQIAEQKTLLALKDADIAIRVTAIEQNEQRIHELEETASGLQADKVALNAEISRLQQLDSLSRQRMAMQKKQIDQLKTHAAALESELVALGAQNESKNNEIERYRSYRVVRLIDKLTDTDK